MRRRETAGGAENGVSLVATRTGVLEPRAGEDQRLAGVPARLLLLQKSNVELRPLRNATTPSAPPRASASRVGGG